MATDAVFADRAQALRDAFPAALTQLCQEGALYADGFYEHTDYQYGRWTQRARGRIATPDVSLSARTVDGIALQTHMANGVRFAATADSTPTAVRPLAHTLASIQGLATPVRHAAAPPPILLRALLERAADAALGWQAQVTQVRAEVQARVRHTLVVNTAGVSVSQIQPLTMLRVVVHLHTAQGQAVGRAQHTAPLSLDDLEASLLDQLAVDAVHQAQRLADARPFAAGTYPAVLRAGCGGAWLHEVIGHRLEADVAPHDGSVALGSSVAPEWVTVTDGEHLPNGYTTAAYDDEGTPHQRTVLIANGQATRWLTDRARAHALALPLTGNGRRSSYATPPLPRMTHLALAPGPAAPSALVEAVSHGLLVHQLGEGAIDLPSRSYRVFVREGQCIEQGRPTYPVRDVWLEGALDDALHTVQQAAHAESSTPYSGVCVKQGQAVPVACSLPSALLSQIAVRPS